MSGCFYDDDCEGCNCNDKTKICYHCWESHYDKWVENHYIKKTVKKKETGCTCGAKHTSRKDFHLDWCDKERKR